MKEKVLKIYKQILLSSKQTFGEDEVTLKRVVQNIRTKFKENKNETDPVKIEEKLKAAEDAENFIRSNIVQGVYKDDPSNIRLRIPKDLPSNSLIEPINKIRIK